LRFLPFLAKSAWLNFFYEIGSHSHGSRTPGKARRLRSTTSGKADILVAFRVIRQDADGSLHILWKKLADYPVTILKGKPKK
jgi:hypothetical protein